MASNPPARGAAPGIRAWKDLLPVAGLLLLSSLAFAHLMALPAFADEAGQVRWIWRAIEAAEWLQPLGDGKPLEAWPMVPLVWLGVQPLMAARALHVLAGMIGVVLTYRLALRFGDRGSALVSGALFAMCPFVVYLQRLALSDMFLCTAGIWVLLGVIRFIEVPAWPSSIGVAAGLVLTAFCKFPVGFVFLISMPLAILIMPASERRRLLHPPALTQLIAAHVPATLLALAVLVSAILRVRRGQSPGFGLQDFIGIGLGHYRDIAAAMGVQRPRLIGELTAQLSWPVTIIGLTGLVAAGTSKDWRQRWLIAVGALPMLAIGFLADFWFSRYLLFTLPPLIVGAVSGWHSLSLRTGAARRPLQFAALALCVGFMAHQSALIILDPGSANWSPTDRYQYFESPGSGFGYPEAARFVLQSPHPPQLIYSLDGYSAYQLLAYLPAGWHGRVKPIYYGSDGAVLHGDEQRLGNLLSRATVWIIAPEQLLQGDLQSSFGRLDPSPVHLRRLAEFDKPGFKTRLGIFEVTRP
jgi:4-amino-4-deoxy-L-arabinose transferase-like glycosyltransferase